MRSCKKSKSWFRRRYQLCLALYFFKRYLTSSRYELLPVIPSPWVSAAPLGGLGHKRTSKTSPTTPKMGVIWQHMQNVRVYIYIDLRTAWISSVNYVHVTDKKRILTLRAQCQSPVRATLPAPVMYPRPLKTHRTAQFQCLSALSDEGSSLNVRFTWSHFEYMI